MNTSLQVWLLRKSIGNLCSLHQRTHIKIVMLVRFAIQQHFIHIASLAFRLDIYFLAVLQMKFHRLEIRSSQHILATSRTNRIESHRRENIPSRGLTIIFITTITIWSWRIELVHHLANPVLSLPRLTAIAIEIDGVLDKYFL